MKSDKPVIGVFGHYGNHNLGDELIIESSFNSYGVDYPRLRFGVFRYAPTIPPNGIGSRLTVFVILRVGVNTFLPDEADTFSLPWKVYAQQQQARSDDKDGSADAARGSKCKRT